MTKANGETTSTPSGVASDGYGTVGGTAGSTGIWIRDTAKWLETSKDTDPAHLFTWCCEDFKPRKLKAPLVLIWLVLQALGLFFQLCLFWETSRHLSDYEDTLSFFCGPDHQRNGICIGPNWNVSYSSTLTFPPMQSEDSRSDFDFVIPADRSFSFRTASNPPTFLLGIEPQSPHTKARWKVSVGGTADRAVENQALNGKHLGALREQALKDGLTNAEIDGALDEKEPEKALRSLILAKEDLSGVHSQLHMMKFTDLEKRAAADGATQGEIDNAKNDEVNYKNAMVGLILQHEGSMVEVLPATFGTGSRYKVVVGPAAARGTWTGSMQLMSKYTDSTSIRVYVVDSRIQHLEDVHKQPQCSFEESWQNFNERHNGEHHKVLTNARRATAFFLAISVGTFAVMFQRFYFYVESGKLLSRVIAVKFLVQDFPQQLCIVAYFYGWYAQNGLRCQMCLFHPQHCDDEHPLHFSNLLVCIFTLLSASSNQLLLQAKAKRYEEEEECFLVLARGAIFSVSVLPFSTGLFFLSSSLLHFRSVLLYLMAGVPTLVGWGTLLCVPMFAICEDELIV